MDITELNWADLEVVCETVIYIIRPESKAALQVASQVKNCGRRYRYQLHYVPKRSFLCDQLFRNQGVFDLLEHNIYEYHLGLVPYDTDVLSLGLDNSFAQVNLDSDDSTLMYAARALLEVQDLLGPIPNIKVKGDHSKKLLDMILRMRVEAEEEMAAADLAKEYGDSVEDLDDASTGSDESVGDSFNLGAEEDGIDSKFLKAPSLANDSQSVAPLKSDLAFAVKTLRKGAKDTKGNGEVVESQIDTLVMIDRNIDLVTPLCTALTYESLIDEIVGIRNGHAMVDSELVNSGLASAPKQPGVRGSVAGSKVSMSLNSADHVYKEIRDLNIDVVLGRLNTKAREMKDGWQNVKTKEVEDLHNYVQQSLKNHVQESQLLPRHINIVNRLRETVYDLPFRKMWTVEREILEGDNQVAYIEECIARQESWTKVIRLACLQSLAGNGIPSKQLDSLRRSIVHAYGFELAFTLDKLEKLGMLKRSGESASSWSSLVNKFRLIPSNPDEPNQDPGKPRDISYVTSGYAPLSARLIELLIKPGWDKSRELLKRLPGRTIHKVKQHGVTFDSGSSSSTNNAPEKKKVMMVFFTGGVSFCEISALRFIASQDDCPYEIVVASTNLMNNKTLLQSIRVANELENRLR